MKLTEVSRRGFLKGAAAAGLTVSTTARAKSTRVTVDIPHAYIQRLVDNEETLGHDFDEALEVVVANVESILDDGQWVLDSFNY